MSQITVDAFLNTVDLIRKEKPSYKVGHDTSDGTCDNIGFIRGALLRSGVRKIKYMKESNQCARRLRLQLREIDSVSRGDIVFKTCDIDDSFIPLSSKYRVGGADYNGDMNNYYDVGIVTKVNPVEILHMTKKGIKKDKKLSNWNYGGWLPFILEERRNDCMTKAIVSSNDSVAKLYSDPSFACKEFVEIANDTVVVIIDNGNPWAHVSFDGNNGYVLSKYLHEQPVETKLPSNDEIERLREAYKIIGEFLDRYDGKEISKKRKHRFF